MYVQFTSCVHWVLILTSECNTDKMFVGRDTDASKNLKP